MKRYNLISADSHLNLPRDIYERYGRRNSATGSRASIPRPRAISGCSKMSGSRRWSA
jgi:hypothetical protein